MNDEPEMDEVHRATMKAIKRGNKLFSDEAEIVCGKEHKNIDDTSKQKGQV